MVILKFMCIHAFDFIPTITSSNSTTIQRIFAVMLVLVIWWWLWI